MHSDDEHEGGRLKKGLRISVFVGMIWVYFQGGIKMKAKIVYTTNDGISHDTEVELSNAEIENLRNGQLQGFSMAHLPWASISSRSGNSLSTACKIVKPNFPIECEYTIANSGIMSRVHRGVMLEIKHTSRGIAALYAAKVISRYRLRDRKSVV